MGWIRKGSVNKVANALSRIMDSQLNILKRIQNIDEEIEAAEFNPITSLVLQRLTAIKEEPVSYEIIGTD